MRSQTAVHVTESQIDINPRWTVCNVQRSGRNRTLKGSSWKGLWIGEVGQDKWDKCSIRQCPKNAEVGAHIFIRQGDIYTADDIDFHRDTFILPMCRGHNSSKLIDHGNGFAPVKDKTIAVRCQPCRQLATFSSDVTVVSFVNDTKTDYKSRELALSFNLLECAIRNCNNSNLRMKMYGIKCGIPGRDDPIELCVCAYHTRSKEKVKVHIYSDIYVMIKTGDQYRVKESDLLNNLTTDDVIFTTDEAYVDCIELRISRAMKQVPNWSDNPIETARFLTAMNENEKELFKFFGMKSSGLITFIKYIVKPNNRGTYVMNDLVNHIHTFKERFEETHGMVEEDSNSSGYSTADEDEDLRVLQQLDSGVEISEIPKRNSRNSSQDPIDSQFYKALIEDPDWADNHAKTARFLKDFANENELKPLDLVHLITRTFTRDDFARFLADSNDEKAFSVWNRVAEKLENLEYESRWINSRRRSTCENSYTAENQFEAQRREFNSYNRYNDDNAIYSQTKTHNGAQIIDSRGRAGPKFSVGTGAKFHCLKIYSDKRVSQCGLKKITHVSDDDIICRELEPCKKCYR